MQDKSSLLIKQENLELNKENEALKETVTKLLVEIERLRNLPVRINTPNLNQTIEEQIINDQIKEYQAIAVGKAMDIDDIRALDLLIKNKRLLEQHKPIEPEWSELSDTPDKELLRLAGDVEVKKPRRNKSKTGSKDTVE